MAATADLAIKIVAQDQASAAIDGLHGKLGGLGGVMSSVAGVAAGALAGGIVAAGGALAASVTAAAGFESKMSAIKAVSGATAAEMATLQQLALDLGAATSFSASEAAEGIGELIKAGVSIGDVMGGGASAALSLAAAGAVEVKDAAEIASNAMNAFGLSGADMAHVADTIAGAANASAIDVMDFKYSLAAVGAVANAAGLSFDDTAVAIAELGQAGIKGSDAGTSLKAFIAGLTPSSKTATAAMKQLGLITADGGNQFFDAAGKMKSMEEIQLLLQEATKDLTEQQRLMAFETIFGSDAIRAAAVLAKEGSTGFAAMAESMSKVTAEAVAAERLNNLKGSIEQLMGSLETAAIGIGLKFTPALKAIVDGATQVVNEAGPALAAFAAQASDALVEAGRQIGDAWRTAQQAWEGNWTPSDQIEPFVNAVGQAVLKLRELTDVIQSALQKAGDTGAWDAAARAFANLGDAARLGGERVDDITAALGRARGPSGQAASAADILAAAIRGGALALQLASLKVEEFVDGLGAGIAVLIDYSTAASKISEAMYRLSTGDFPGAIAALNESRTAFGAGTTAAEEFRQRGLERTAEATRIMAELTGQNLTVTRAAVESNMAAAAAAVGEGSSGMQRFMEENGATMAAAAETHMGAVESTTSTLMQRAAENAGSAASNMQSVVGTAYQGMTTSVTTHGDTMESDQVSTWSAISVAAMTSLAEVSATTATEMSKMSGSVASEGAAAAGSFQGSMNDMAGSTSGPERAIDSLLSSFQGLWNWLNNHVFRFRIDLPDLPDWAIPGSPTPLEIGFRGIAAALTDLGSLASPALGAVASAPLVPALTPALAGATSGPAAAGGTGGGGSVTLHFHGPVYGADDLEDVVLRALNTANRRGRF